MKKCVNLAGNTYCMLMSMMLASLMLLPPTINIDDVDVALSPIVISEQWKTWITGKCFQKCSLLRSTQIMNPNLI